MGLHSVAPGSSPSHRRQITLGRAPAAQRRVLALDFAPLLIAPSVAAAPLSAGSVVRYIAILVVLGSIVGVVGWRRISRVNVAVDDGEIRIDNVLRSWAVPISKVRKVVARRSWVGGIYADCFGLRVKGRWGLRSIPIHALAGSDDQVDELMQVLGVPT